MNEYILFDISSIILVFLLDRGLNTGLFTNKKFWVFHLISFFLILIGDNYWSWRPFYIFNESELLGVRLGFMPLENYFFGFSLLTLNLILFEYFQNYGKNK